MSEKAEIEEKILDAALKVVADNTISGTRMRLIAEHANMVQSNVHYYYKTKNDLMRALQKKVLSGFVRHRQEMLDGAENSLKGNLKALLRQKKEIMEEQPEYDYVQTDFWLQAHIDPEARAHMEESYQLWRGDILAIFDRFCPKADAGRKELAASVLVAMMDGASMQYLIDPDRIDWDEYFDLCLDMVVRSLKSGK